MQCACLNLLRKSRLACFAPCLPSNTHLLSCKHEASVILCLAHCSLLARKKIPSRNNRPGTNLFVVPPLFICTSRYRPHGVQVLPILLRCNGRSHRCLRCLSTTGLLRNLLTSGGFLPSSAALLRDHLRCDLHASSQQAKLSVMSVGTYSSLHGICVLSPPLQR